MVGNGGPSSFKDLNDEQLVSLAKGGDNDALEYLINKYRGVVKRRSRAYFLIGGDKEDLIQEGMIGLFKAIRDYCPGKASSFRAFAELCITRQLITAIKTASRRKHTPLNSYVSLDGPVYDDEQSASLLDIVPKGGKAVNPEDIMITREQQSDIGEMLIKALSKYERAVFTYYLQGASYQEIGRILGKDPKSIDNALQRIKKKVVRLIGESKLRV